MSSIVTAEELFSCLIPDEIQLTTKQHEKARKLDEETLYNIGEQYFKMKLYFKAFVWFYVAAKQNYSPAQYKVGYMYHHGHGVYVNYGKAIEWYLEADKSDGNKDAQSNIGDILRQGLGGPMDIPAAIEWYRKSANQGNAYAQFLLGDMYMGEEEVKDLQKSVNWYKKASNNGCKYSEICLNELIRIGYYPEIEVESEEDRMVDDASKIGQLLLTKKIGKDSKKPIDEEVNGLMESFEFKLDLIQQELAEVKIQCEENDQKIKKLESASIQSRYILLSHPENDTYHD